MKTTQDSPKHSPLLIAEAYIWHIKHCVQVWPGYDSSFNEKAVLPQGNRAMPQVFFSVEVRQQLSLQV